VTATLLVMPACGDDDTADAPPTTVSVNPVGTVVRDEPGPNAPWSWHIDPATFEFAFATTEVCDGIPSDVEDGTITSDQYCPWSAKVIAVDG
jgi:hypothetical protein